MNIVHIAHKFKHKLRPVLTWLAKNNGILAIVWLLLALFLCNIRKLKILNDNWFDFSIFSVMIFTILSERIVANIQTFIVNKYEDENKLTTDYELLIKKYYSPNFIVFQNNLLDGVSKENLHRLLHMRNINNVSTIDRFPVVFPVVLEANIHGKQIFVHDEFRRFYKLPEDVASHFDELIKAHSSSNIFNQMTIRVDDWKVEQSEFHIYTSRTTYFNSLVTNRSMDYVWSNGITIRDLLDFDPFILPLNQSKLSNHLGFNGFIESADGYFPLVFRNSIMSMGKHTYGDSISASLKSKYALDSNQLLTVEGIEYAILKEICNELDITRDQLLWKGLKYQLLAAYRDMVEGGKPHFLFYVKSTLSKSNIDTIFKEKKIEHKKMQKKLKNDKETKTLKDGDKLLWLSRAQIKELAISPGYIIHQKKIYEMTPSASACVVLLREYLKRG